LLFGDKRQLFRELMVAETGLLSLQPLNRTKYGNVAQRQQFIKSSNLSIHQAYISMSQKSAFRRFIKAIVDFFKFFLRRKKKKEEKD